MKNYKFNIIYCKGKSLNELFVDSLIKEIKKLYKNDINDFYLSNSYIDNERK